MANYCLSIDLAASCCNINYLQHICSFDAKLYRGRYYMLVWGSDFRVPYLYCNGVCVGEVCKGTLGIYSQFAPLGLNKSSLASLISLFNLYPL